MRVTVFGANGPTGRLLTAASIAAGHETVAVTRRPELFPYRQATVVAGDVRDQSTVDTAVEGSDAVLSSLGVPFGKEPVEVYSGGVGRILDAMKRSDVPRLVVVSSSTLTAGAETSGGLLFRKVLQPYVTNHLGRTVYDDMRRMEALVVDSEVDWTILRPSGLYALPAVTDYSLTPDRGPGRFTARIDLADALLRQLADTRFVRGVAHVVTTADNPSLLSMLWREARRS